MDIYPYTPDQLPAVYERLLADPAFQNVIHTIMPDTPFEQFATLMRSCPDNLTFQQRCVSPFISKLLQTCADGLTSDFCAIDFSRGYTFITNHRDIVLDSAILSYLLIQENHDTVEIAIGDNLLIRPWIRDLVRINRSFIVQRSLTMREMLLASKTMSEYIHHVITEKHSNVWIAQREGRAKDSNDLTQESVLKMLAMGGPTSDVIKNIRRLNIVPVAISYEYDPCDYLKAMEFQQKRDNPDYRKTPQDDLDNMRIGIFGKKGHIHYQAAPCINDWLDTLDPTMPRTDFFTCLAHHIDEEIHRSYRIYPINEDALSSRANEYIETQLRKITLPVPDIPFLRYTIQAMYANPLRNKNKTN